MTYRIRQVRARGAGVADNVGGPLNWFAFMSAQAVGEALGCSTLRSTDLVFEDGVWVPLARLMAFSDAAAPAVKREAWVQLVKSAGWLVAMVVGAVTYMVVRVYFGV